MGGFADGGDAEPCGDGIRRWRAVVGARRSATRGDLDRHAVHFLTTYVAGV